MKRMPIGVDDFKEAVTGYYYVDKTLFIKELLDHHSKVTLITRPRRFGKTINMSMLSYFFSIDHKKSAALFDSLAIASAGGGAYLSERNQYPVIFLTLKDVQNDTWEMLFESFKLAISAEYQKHSYLLEGDALGEYEKEYFKKIIHTTASAAEYQVSLAYLTLYLWKYHGREPVILIDEYDAPLQYAYECGFYKEAISYFRTFYNKSLKGNSCLKLAVLTGVMRIAKESIFSGLNNLEVDSVFSERYSDAFGFTEEEVEAICRSCDCEKAMGLLKYWYDGYHFGKSDLYNPWSVINFFSNHLLAHPYWVNTSGNSILQYLLSRTDTEKMRALQNLLAGNSIEVPVNESVVYDDIETDKAALFTMLLTTGYLTAKENSDGILNAYSLKIPNEEIRQLYSTEIMNHLTDGFTQYEFDYMLKALVTGDKDSFESYLQDIILKTVGTFDTANKEIFYHALLLGMLARFQGDRYHVLSEKEGGYGRFDIALVPQHKDIPGVVLELKYAPKEEALSAFAEKAEKQIEEKSYEKGALFPENGKVWKYGIAFHGKKLAVAMAK